ncbi:TraB/GumN family protein [Aestuariispira insulae]|uniref:TraB family protein n=1 Tax=Aestuariispira insulae TaxID=1461337 RepID=A0A3D9HE32_9PROT|nr:TraB/GumN family protein [Aestuariispira insulae]RED47747.1 hypothetical protein DFP90_109111 [Aestuariispira insulae]
MLLCRPLITMFRATVFLLFSATVGHADPATWVVRDQDTTVYLFGTIHIAPNGLDWLDEDMKGKLDRSQRLYLELSPEESSEEKAMAAVQKHGLLTPGESLKSRVGSELYEKLGDILAESGMPRNGFDMMRPWMIAINITVMEFVKRGMDPEYGSEKVIQAYVADKGKDIRGFETMEQQLGLFSSLTPEEENSFLENSLDQLAEIDRDADALINAWMSGDTAALERIQTEGFEGHETLIESLIYARNRNWTGQIRDIMAEPGTFFIAVGAVHLVGDLGVPTLLQREGFQVERDR